jgi:hypothetical protein
MNVIVNSQLNYRLSIRGLYKKCRSFQIVDSEKISSIKVSKMYRKVVMLVEGDEQFNKWNIKGAKNR